MIKSTLGKILVIDDEVELKAILVESLASHGYETSGFSSGEEALVALRGEAFDLLLTDLMMPEMDGIAVVYEALKIDPHLVAIVMTGQGTIQTAVEAMKVGAFDYVLKPFKLQTMMPILTRAMNTRHMRLENLQLRETVAIYELSQTIAFTLDRQTIISKLADAALQQTDADEVSILLPTEDGKELYVAAVRGANRQKLLGERVPLQASISSWVVHERTPLILDGEVNDERFRALWPRPEIRSAISIPMQVANKLIGTININALNRARPFTLGQLKALTILASTASAALESASLFEQVQRAEENYRSIFENAVEGIFRSTPEGRFLTVNPAMARILGYESPDDLIASLTNLTRQLYVDPKAREKTLQLQADRGVVQGFEFEAYRKDGKKIWLSLNRRSVRDESGIELYREGSVEDITERKRAEEERERLAAEIERQRQRLDNIVGSVPGVVWEAWGEPNAATQRIDFVSEYVEKLLGHSVEEWLSTPNFWLTIVHPDDREEAARVAGKSFHSGKGATQEFRWMTKAGGAVWVESNYVVIKDDECRPIGLLVVNTDISERKRAEEQLRRQLDFTEAITSSLGEGLYALDRKGRVTFMNPAAEAALGWTQEELQGRTMHEVIHFQHADGTPQSIDECPLLGVIRSGQSYKTESDGFTRKDGTTFAVSYNSSPILTNDRIEGAVLAFHDITERQRAETALRESEERYRDLVENAHDIIFSHDLEGNYTSMNKAGTIITGYTLEEALKLNMAKTVAPEYRAKAREMLKRKLAGEPVTVYEMEIIAKDGRRITVEANTKLVYHDGVAIRVQGIARDITHRKVLEDQLRQSQKIEAIGQLAGGVAHDFNNLLTAINGYSSLALQRIDENSPIIKGYLEEIKKAGDRAANLTRQLLAFGRKQILQPLPINLNDVVTDMNKMLKRLIGEDILLTAKLDPALKKIKADPGQIEQVLVNLVVNARDAMPQGGSLTIETAMVELDETYANKHVGVTPGNYVVLAVSDTGVGMDEATQERIFDPFFTTKEKGKGTGLGLSTVYGIIKQSGGSVWVYTEPDRGTTFRVYLPQIETAGPATQKAEAELPVPTGSETIVLVEDEEVVRGLTREILEQAGYTVLDTARGEEAVEICSEPARQIHLLLTDVVMPEISGKDVADRVAKVRPHVKVLFMSGYTDEAIVHHGVLDSNVEFIQKPFTPAALARKVRNVLDSNGCDQR